jgi:hypothetical protein
VARRKLFYWRKNSFKKLHFSSWPSTGDEQHLFNFNGFTFSRPKSHNVAFIFPVTEQIHFMVEDYTERLFFGGKKINSDINNAKSL